MKKQGLNRNKGFTLIELMIVVAIIGILASMAIPDYLGFMARVKQAEARTNLAGIFTAELSYFSETGSYTDDFNRLGWSPQTINKYAYDLGNGNICYPNTVESRCWDHPTPIDAPQNNAPPGVSRTQFTAIAYGNVDADLDIDTWQINDVKKLTCTFDDSR